MPNVPNFEIEVKSIATSEQVLGWIQILISHPLIGFEPLLILPEGCTSIRLVLFTKTV